MHACWHPPNVRCPNCTPQIMTLRRCEHCYCIGPVTVLLSSQPHMQCCNCGHRRAITVTKEGGQP